MASRTVFLSFILSITVGSGLFWDNPVFAEQELFPFLAETTADRVNVRAGQSANFERLCQLGKGEEVIVLEKNYSWYKIQLPLSAKSYVNKDYVQYLGQNAGGVTADRVNIRAGADIHFTVLGQLFKGEQIFIEEELEEWYRIRPVTKSYGWVAEEFLSFKSQDVGAYQDVMVSQPIVIKRWEEPKPAETEGEKIIEEEAVLDKENVEEENVDVAENIVKKEVVEIVQEKKMIEKKEVIGKDVVAKEIIKAKSSAHKALPIKAIKRKEAPPLLDIGDTGIHSVVGYIEPYENDGTDDIHYQIVSEGQTACYVQGGHHMLSRFERQKVTIDGVINQKLLSQYAYPVIIVSKIKLML